MLQILLAIREYLNQRGVITRIFAENKDIDDDIEWMIHDADTLAKWVGYHLTSHYKTRESYIYFGSPDTTITVCKVGNKSRVFNMLHADSLQKIYEFITRRN